MARLPLILVVNLILASSTIAQDKLDAPGPEGKRSADTDFAGIYVNDSFDAADAVIKAEALARRDRWRDAAQLLQDTSDSLGDQLIRIGPGHYVGLRQHINRLIASWPTKGIDAYRAMYEHTMRSKADALPTDASTREWLTLFSRFYNTATAADVGDGIAQRAIEAGDLSLAVHVHRQLLAFHPDREALRARSETMLAIIDAMSGDTPSVTPAADSNSSVRWMGRNRPLREALAEIAAGFHVQRDRPAPSTWPMYGGNRQRSRVTETRVDELGLLWDFAGFSAGAGDSTSGSGSTDDQERNLRLTIQPITDDRFVFAQMGREIVALHRATGAVAWRFRADSGGEHELIRFDEHPPGWDSPTLSDGRVFASIPGDTVPYYSYESAHSPPELTCIDADTGRVIWRVDQDAIEESFAEIVFDSSPLVRHDQVYVVGRRQRSFGFADSYLFRFDAKTGALEHRTHLGSASTSSFGNPNIGRSIAVMRGDTVYACTNLGTAVAVSAHTGETKWLRLYPRNLGEDNRGDAEVTQHRSRSPAHTITLTGNLLTVFPTDSRPILVFSAGDGELQQVIEPSVIGDAEIIVAASNDLIYTSGRQVSCYDLNTRSLVWSSALADGDRPFGQGVLTEDRLLIPTRTRLSQFALSDGARTDSLWPGDRKGGNLVAAPDQLLVAGPGRIAAYVRKAQIWLRLRERMAAAPTDPLPAMELAEIAMSNGDFAEAIDVLREAVHRVEQSDRSVEQEIFRRLHSDAVDFANRLADKRQLDENSISILFAIAAQYASDPATHVAYRFRFAELFVQANQFDRAIAAYQQVLRDRTLRSFSTTKDNHGGESPGNLARAAIDEIIHLHGDDHYASFASEAKSWLEQARDKGSVEMLQRVVDVFPNSPSAPLALIAMGRLLAERGDATGAARSLAHAYHRYGDEVDRPDLIRRIADGYEAAGELGRAYLWLTKATREYPTARFKYEGRSTSFQEYRERLAHVRSQVEASLPQLNPPLSGRFSAKFSDDVALLTPRFGDAPESDWTRYYVYTAKGVTAYDSRTGSPIWASAVPVPVDPSLLISTNTTAVLATANQILGIDVASGTLRWSHGVHPAHLDQVDGDWEDGHTIRGLTYYSGRLVSARDDGEMTAIDVGTGNTIWTQFPRGGNPGRMRLLDGWMIYDTTQNGETVICLIDGDTGAWVDTLATAERSSTEELFLTLDGQAILVTARAVSAFDLDARSHRWRTEMDGHLRRASLMLDLDALYFSENGRSVRKISLEDGRILWDSEQMAHHGADGLTVQKRGANIVASTSSSIGAIDALTGLTLWNGTTRAEPDLVQRIVTSNYVLAVDRASDDDSGVESTAYFYDLRNASGLIPRDGGITALGDLNDVRTIMAVDGALLIQTGKTILGWRQD